MHYRKIHFIIPSLFFLGLNAADCAAVLAQVVQLVKEVKAPPKGGMILEPGKCSASVALTKVEKDSILQHIKRYIFPLYLYVCPLVICFIR